MRIGGVRRGTALLVSIDGASVAAHEGETVATALLGAELRRIRDDRAGKPRGLFCNMGTCSECMLWIRSEAGDWRRRRACLAVVAPGMHIATGEDAPDAD